MALVLEADGGKIKPPKYKQEYTSEQIIELAKCRLDPIYFISRYCKVRTTNRGVVPFDLYDYQRRMITEYQLSERVISMLPRQSGKTAATAAYLLWVAIFSVVPQSIFIAANKGENATEVMTRVKQLYEDLEWWIKPGLEVNNVMSLKFDNGSTMKASTTTPTTGRGYSISLLYLDEFAYLPPNIQSAFWASIQPTLATGGRAIITSTPNTDEDKFAQVWFSATDSSFGPWVDAPNMLRRSTEEYETVYEDPAMAPRPTSEVEDAAEAKPVGFTRFYVRWNEHPERDEAFKRKMLAEVTYQSWEREFCCKFVSADATLIDSLRLSTMSQLAKPPIFVDRFGVHWYEPIDANTAYAISLDPSEGTGGDPSVIQVWRLPDLAQVAEWSSNEIDQVEQTKMLIRVIKRIDGVQQDDPEHMGGSEIYYTVECNGVGQGILNAIMVEGEDKIPGMLIDSDGNKTRGVRTTERSKLEYALQLKVLIERNKFLPASKGLISELKDFVRSGKSFRAKPGSTDDRVMSCIIMLHMVDELKHYVDGIEESMHVDLLEEEDAPLPIIM